MKGMLAAVDAVGITRRTSSFCRRFHHHYPLLSNSNGVAAITSMMINSVCACWVRKGFSTTTTNIPSSEEKSSCGDDDENCSNKRKERMAMLELEEVEEILRDVRADDVRVIPISTPIHLPSSDSSSSSSSSWMDYMVLATGRSPWHVRNIAQALIHRVKEKQKGAEHMVLPRVHGYQGGKWVLVDSGNVVVHALDEKARAYYNLEDLYAERASNKTSEEDLRLFLEQPKEEELPRC